MTLLQQQDLLTKPSQRLAAITFLYDMYKADSVSNNPFAPVFIQLLSPSDSIYEPGDQMGYGCQLPRLSPSERQFLTQLLGKESPTHEHICINLLCLGGQGRDFMKRSAGSICRSDPTTVPGVDLTNVQLTLAQSQSQLPVTARARSATNQNTALQPIGQ